MFIYFAVDFPQSIGAPGYWPYTTFSFFVGVGTSMLCGWIGMSVATLANVKTTWACNVNIDEGFQIAFRGGKVLGFCLVGIAILNLQLLVVIYRELVLPTSLGASDKDVVSLVRGLFEVVAGYTPMGQRKPTRIIDAQRRASAPRSTMCGQDRCRGRNNMCT